MLSIAAAKPAPANLRFMQGDATSSFDGGPYDAICAFQVLHLVDDLDGTLRHIHSSLQPGGLLISKTWCFADMGLRLRALFIVLRSFGMFPPARRLTRTGLRQAIQGVGFEIIDERLFGTNQHGPYIVARKVNGSVILAPPCSS